MSTNELEAAYQTAEAQLRAYYAEIAAKYRATQEAGGWQSAEALAVSPEWTWTQREQEILGELRDRAADAALALLQGRGWFRNHGTTA